MNMTNMAEPTVQQTVIWLLNFNKKWKVRVIYLFIKNSTEAWLHKVKGSLTQAHLWYPRYIFSQSTQKNRTQELGIISISQLID